LGEQVTTIMGIVRFALRLPHTFYVLATLVLFLSTTAILSMPIDTFPEIDIPVVIGGLLFATPTTLLVVAYLFARLRKGNDGKPAHGVFAEDPQ
jgi:multidrug efflux pump subunit AcrB